jgi:hypothetical protein
MTEGYHQVEGSLRSINKQRISKRTFRDCRENIEYGSPTSLYPEPVDDMITNPSEGLKVDALLIGVEVQNQIFIFIEGHDDTQLVLSITIFRGVLHRDIDLSSINQLPQVQFSTVQF